MASSCPKCGTAVQAGAVACTKCGLAVERMEGFAAASDAAIPDALIAAWDRAVERWDDQTRHDEVLRLVTAHDAYAWAAQRYRGKTDPIGERMLERVRKSAEATMMAARAERTVAAAPKAYRATVGLLVLLLIAAVAGLIYTTVLRNRTAGPDQTEETK